MCLCVRAHTGTHEQAGTHAHLISRKTCSRQTWFSSMMEDLFISCKTVCNAGTIEKLFGFCSFSEGEQINEEPFLFVFIAPPGGELAYFSCMLILPAWTLFIFLSIYGGREKEIKYFDFSRFIFHDHRNKLLSTLFTYSEDSLDWI